MTVILINDENHGQIGVAKDYKTAIEFLISERWITDYTEIWLYDEHAEEEKYGRIADVFGEDWADVMRDSWTIKNFNDYWTDSFWMEEVEVYGA